MWLVCTCDVPSIIQLVYCFFGDVFVKGIVKFDVIVKKWINIEQIRNRLDYFTHCTPDFFILSLFESLNQWQYYLFDFLATQ